MNFRRRNSEHSVISCANSGLSSTLDSQGRASRLTRPESGISDVSFANSSHSDEVPRWRNGYFREQHTIFKKNLIRTLNCVGVRTGDDIHIRSNNSTLQNSVSITNLNAQTRLYFIRHEIIFSMTSIYQYFSEPQIKSFFR